MVICEAEQGSEQWHLDRCMIPTASQFSKIYTGTGKASTSSTTYMNELLANWLAGKPVDIWEGNEATEIGTEREAASRDQYSFITGNEVTEMGFCMRDDKMSGCSVDGLVGEDGLWEAKNPKASTLVSYRLGGKLPSKYVPQVQGQLFIMEREWCDFFVAHPDLEPFLIRVERDEKYIAGLSKAIANFNEVMLEKRELLKAA